jgi:hypothetical protein
MSVVMTKDTGIHLDGQQRAGTGEEVFARKYSDTSVAVAYINSYDRNNVNSRSAVDQLFAKHRNLAFRKERGLTCL